MQHRMVLLIAVILTMVVSLACAISFGGQLSEDDKLATAVSQTMEALETTQAEQISLLNEVSGITPEITIQTTVSPHTTTPQPCNRAKFEGETIPDNSEFAANTNFTKSWRLRNIGTCTWNTNYQLVFSSGERMSGAASVNLPRSVAPGELVDVSVNLKSPPAAGTFRGDWKVRDDSGNFFVHRLWVQIKVQAAAPPPLPPAATIYKAGSLIINPTGTADLDEGVVSAGAAKDIWSQNTGAEQNLVPESGARIAVLGNSPPLMILQCMVAVETGTTPIPFTNVPVGTYVCYLTNQGRPGVFRVSDLTAGFPQTISIEYETWNAP